MTRAIHWKIILQKAVGVLLLPSLLAVSCPLLAADQPVKSTIFSFYKEDRIDQEGHFGYSKMVLDFQSQTDVPFAFIVRPTNRALRDFAENRNSCLFGATPILQRDIEMAQQANVFLISDPVDFVRANFFSLKNASSPLSAEDADEPRIAIIQGASLPLIFDQPFIDKATFIFTYNEPQNFNMLQSGRADYIFGWVPDTLIAAEKNGIEMLRFDKDKYISEHSVHLLCHGSRNHSALIQSFNKYLVTTKESGLLTEFFGKHAMIAPTGAKGRSHLRFLGKTIE